MRVVLVLLGVAMGGYGALLLWESPWVIIVRIVTWAVVAAVVHDFVFAPVCAALGWTGRRVIPERLWAPVSVAGVCTVVLVLLAIPVYSKPGAHPDNSTVLDRDYQTGLWIALAVVWACVPLYFVIARLLPVREDEAVQQQGADDVEPQPPPV